MKAKWTAQILEVMGEIQRHVSNITIPYLLLHGDDDRVVWIEGSHFLHDNSPSTDKTFKVCKSVDEKIIPNGFLVACQKRKFSVETFLVSNDTVVLRR